MQLFGILVYKKEKKQILFEQYLQVLEIIECGTLKTVSNDCKTPSKLLTTKNKLINTNDLY